MASRPGSSHQRRDHGEPPGAWYTAIVPGRTAGKQSRFQLVILQGLRRAGSCGKLGILPSNKGVVMGRPRGYVMSQESKEQTSRSMKDYWADVKERLALLEEMLEDEELESA